MNKHLTKILSISIFALTFFVLSLYICATGAHAITATNIATGNWSTTTNWDIGIVPTATMDAIITKNTKLTVNGNYTINSIHFANANSGAVVSTLEVNSPNTLTVTTGIYTASSSLVVDHKVSSFHFISGTGTVNCASLTMHDATLPSAAAITTFKLNSTITNLSISGNFTINSTASGNKYDNNTFNLQSGTVTVGGQIVTTNQAGTSSTSISSFLMNSGAQTGTLKLTGATPWSLSAQATNTITLNGTSAVVNYQGTSAQTTGNLPAAQTYTTLQINNAAGVTQSNTATATTLTVGNVTSNSAFNDGGYQLTSTGTLNLTSGIFKLGTSGTATTFPAFGTNNISSGTTVEYASGQPQTVSAAPSYQDLTFSGAGAKTTASGTVTVGRNWSVTGGDAALNTNNTNVTVTGDITGSGNITSGSGTISLAGAWTNNGTYTANSGTVNYSNTAGGQTVANLTYNNLTLSNTSGTDTAATDITVNGTLTTTASGTLNMVTNQLLGTLSTVTNGGTIRTQNTSSTPVPSGKTWGGTVQYDAASGSQTVRAATYNNLTLSNTSGTSTADAAVTVNGALTTTSGGILNMSTYQLLGTLSTVTNGGIIRTQNTSSTPIPTGKTWGGTMQYDAAGAQTVSASTSYNNLTLAGSGAKTLTGLTTVNGNFSMSGSAAATTASALAVGGNVDLAGTSSLTGGDALTVTGNFTLGATATFVNGAFIHNIAGNWINNGGTFTAGTGTINLNGSGQTISGNTTFHNLTKMIVLADTLTFEASSTQTIEGILTLQGSPGQNLSLRSSVTDSQWYIDPQDGRSVIRLDVQDSNNINATAISVAPSVDSGGNTNWIFSANFLGTVFTDEGSTNIGAGKTVAISVNGGAATTAETDINGVYSLNVNALSGDDVIVYLKDETEKGAAVSRTSGAISNFDIYQNHLIVRHGPDTITNADLATADDNGDTDITSLYSISGSDLTVAAGIDLFIWPGRTFQPGGNVTVENLDIRGIFIPEANTVNVSGDWQNSGTFTAGNSTVILNGASQQTISGTMTGSSSFYNLTLTNASGLDDPGAGVSFTPGIIFASDSTATNNYTIITPSVRVQYNSGSTYTFNNINWNGQATGTNIYFRNSTLASGTWLLNVSGTQTAVMYVNVARSDASGGDQIKADDGTNTDSENNTNWLFAAGYKNFFLLFE